MYHLINIVVCFHFRLIAVSLFLFYASSSHAADVTLAWNPNSENDLAGYAVYSNQGVPGSPYDHVSTYPLNVIDQNSPQCMITGLEDGRSYYFVVTAFDTEGNESGYSNKICVLNGNECPANLELIQAFVTRFYQQCLDRGPDPTGFKDWSMALLNHIHTGADVARGFIYSNEFIAKNTSNEDYLTVLYRAFFNRPPDPTGLNYWLSELYAGRDRGFVLDGFLVSNEFTALCDAYDIIPY